MPAVPGQPAELPLSTRFPPRLRWAGYLLGFALGGFFDGILLHQILQWHHLLLGIERAPFQNIKVQIMADGLFHLFMYVVALIGLRALWRGRADFAGEGGERLLLANALIGFGTWHMLDGILSHWILGIHRVRMDVENVLFWDLLWFVVFGVAVFALGLWLRRKDGPGGAAIARERPRARSLMAWTLLVLGTGAVAALPPRDAATALVFFQPGTAPTAVFAALDEAGARVLWAADSGQVWAVRTEGRNDAAFYRRGAYLVSRSPLALGCLAWTRTTS
ncbi:MAG TPA: DUF2243 domain-containing protein [Noviherbaspirillum sp.]